MSDGIRTRDRLDHNQELYQLSYAHHGLRIDAISGGLGVLREGWDRWCGGRLRLACEVDLPMLRETLPCLPQALESVAVLGKRASRRRSFP